MARLNHVIHPSVPTGLSKVARAIAAAEKINLQHGPTCMGQRGGLQSSHAPRLVHFLGERVHVHGKPKRPPASRLMVQRETPADRAGLEINEEGFGRHENGDGC